MNNKLLRKGILYLIGILIAIAWSAVILLIGNPSRLGGSGWFAFSYVLLGIAVAIICFAVHNNPKNDSSLVGIPFYYSVCYIGIAILINGAYILGEIDSLGSLVIAADIVILVAYLAIMIFSYLHQVRLPQKIKEVEKQTAFSSSVSSTLGAMLSNTNDAIIHKALLKLKEKVDYSTNTTRTNTLNTEISSKLSEIRAALDGGINREKIIELIEEMTSLWNKRNTIQ